MKVRVALSIELDPADWAEAYGFDPADTALIRQDIREDVRSLVLNHMNSVVTIPARVEEVSR